MNLEKFTDRAKGFLQSAQTVAIRMNHQRIAPEHLLKALLEDEPFRASPLAARLRGKSDNVSNLGKKFAKYREMFLLERVCARVCARTRRVPRCPIQDVPPHSPVRHCAADTPAHAAGGGRAGWRGRAQRYDGS